MDLGLKNYKYNDTLPIGKYPFFDYGKVVLKQHEVSIARIDEDTVYHELLAKVTNDIIDSFTNNKITSIKKMNNDRYEVLKFYLTLFIHKSMPSRTMYRYWIKAYMLRFEFILNETAKNLEIISTILNELKMPHVFVRIDNTQAMAIKVNDYLDFDILIKPNDARFAHLSMVNMAVTKGRVFIPVNEIGNFKLIILKLVENRIHVLFDELDLQQARSKKVDSLIKQIQGYIVKDPASEAKAKKQLEYGEITPSMQIQNDKFLEMIKAKPGSIEMSDYPPCVNRLFNKLLKKEILGHPENILLASYMASKGFSKEQMTDIFMLASNADKSKIEYNLDYILERKLKPYNCRKAADYFLCFKDETCERLNLTNPMGYKK